MYEFKFQFGYKLGDVALIAISADTIDEAIEKLKHKITEGLEIANWDCWRIVS